MKWPSTKEVNINAIIISITTGTLLKPIITTQLKRTTKHAEASSTLHRGLHVGMHRVTHGSSPQDRWATDNMGCATIWTRPLLMKLGFFMCYMYRSIVEHSVLYTERNVPWLTEISGRKLTKWFADHSQYVLVYKKRGLSEICLDWLQ